MTHNILVVFFLLVFTFSRPIIAWSCQGCKDVFDNFSQCADFVQGHCINPTTTCCQNIANLNAIANQEKDGSIRICKCIEYFATYKTHRPFIECRILELPLRCNTHLSFPISERMNCSRIILKDNLLQVFS